MDTQIIFNNFSRVKLNDRRDRIYPTAQTNLETIMRTARSCTRKDTRCCDLSRRLCLYDVTQSRVTLRAQHGSDEHQILVCTKLVEPFQAHVDSLYLVLGELEHQDGGSVVKARVLTCVEGMNLPLLEQAVREQRRYQQERVSSQ
ncbi:CST complex subunit TEN1 isoform X1 [Ursus arctos]|uniref:CST complex subunit TEN1 isoform X1 n=1 Tax=Ursus arctos TaxID=9644 RepID=UPI0004DFDF6E|nr:CST complex subunit TEN1 isoform X1 [Ursus arctos]